MLGIANAGLFLNGLVKNTMARLPPSLTQERRPSNPHGSLYDLYCHFQIIALTFPKFQTKTTIGLMRDGPLHLDTPQSNLPQGTDVTAVTCVPNRTYQLYPTPLYWSPSLLLGLLAWWPLNCGLLSYVPLR